MDIKSELEPASDFSFQMQSDVRNMARPGIGSQMTLAFRDRSPEDEPIIKVAPPVVFHQSTHRLPYFAHQQLDPEYFPLGEFPPQAFPKTMP